MYSCSRNQRLFSQRGSRKYLHLCHPHPRRGRWASKNQRPSLGSHGSVTVLKISYADIRMNDPVWNLSSFFFFSSLETGFHVSPGWLECFLKLRMTLIILASTSHELGLQVYVWLVLGIKLRVSCMLGKYLQLLSGPLRVLSCLLAVGHRVPSQGRRG